MYDVLYVTKLSLNLFSVGAPARKENMVQFKISFLSVEEKELSEEWEHKDLMGYISWTL